MVFAGGKDFLEILVTPQTVRPNGQVCGFAATDLATCGSCPVVKTAAVAPLTQSLMDFGIRAWSEVKHELTPLADFASDTGEASLYPQLPEHGRHEPRAKGCYCDLICSKHPRTTRPHRPTRIMSGLEVDLHGTASFLRSWTPWWNCGWPRAQGAHGGRGCRYGYKMWSFLLFSWITFSRQVFLSTSSLQVFHGSL